MGEIWVQTISTVGLIITSAITILFNGKLKKLKADLDQERDRNSELREQIKVSELLLINTQLDSLRDLRNARKIFRLEKAGRMLFRRTKADRFLVVVAFNGRSDFTYVTVIFQLGDGIELDAVEVYNNLEIDKHYNEVLHRAERDGYYLFETEKEQDCLLKEIYEYEKVTHSVLRFVGREKINEEDDILTFTSTATHHENPFTLQELTQIHIVHNGFINSIVQELVAKK